MKVASEPAPGNSATLVSEAKTEFIPKNKTEGKPSPKRKSTPPPYPLNINSLLKSTSLGAAKNKALESDLAPERLPWETEKQGLNLPWTSCLVASLALLLGQIVYFERDNWAQKPSIRPHLEQLCQWLGCRLSDYQHLDELAVLQGSFTPNTDHTIVFKSVINNQAPFRQRLPNIKLTLLDYNEQLLAQRIFLPKEYLPEDKQMNSSIEVDETVEAKLVITEPKTPVGGYSFDLIY